MDNDLVEEYNSLAPTAKQLTEAPYWAVWYTVNPQTGEATWSSGDWGEFLDDEPVTPKPHLDRELCVWNRYNLVRELDLCPQ